MFVPPDKTTNSQGDTMFSGFRTTALAALVAGLASSPARAEIILDVSATMIPLVISVPILACSPTCTLGGDIVINNSAGATNSVISEAIGISEVLSLTNLTINDAANNQLFLLFSP
jgi:hypothetical protein